MRQASVFIRPWSMGYDCSSVASRRWWAWKAWKAKSKDPFRLVGYHGARRAIDRGGARQIFLRLKSDLLCPHLSEVLLGAEETED